MLATVVLIMIGLLSIFYLIFLSLRPRVKRKMMNQWEQWVGRCIHHALHTIAEWIATILRHPSIQEAVAQSIVLGLKQFAQDPEALDVVLQHASDAMSRNLDREALKAGQEFPQLVGNFVKGMIQRGNNNNNNNSSTTSPTAAAAAATATTPTTTTTTTTKKDERRRTRVGEASSSSISPTTSSNRIEQFEEQYYESFADSTEEDDDDNDHQGFAMYLRGDDDDEVEEEENDGNDDGNDDDDEDDDDDANQESIPNADRNQSRQTDSIQY